MKSVITRLSYLVAIVLIVFSSLASAQVQPNTPFADQVVSAGVQFNQASTPQFQGFVAYSKLTSASLGLYSYTKISETAVQFKPSVNVQTQTETGVCAYLTKFGAFDVFGCGSGGIAVAGGSTGVSGTGNLLIVKALKNGWSVGVTGGPSYSGAAGKVAYPLGLVFGWGK